MGTEVRVGTAVILSVFTNREETLVTVPDCTVRPEEERLVAASDGSTGTAAVTTAGASAPSELVLLREEPEIEMSKQ